MKIAIYIRTSKRDQHPENQLKQLLAYVQNKGWDYIIFKEMESTRKTRPVKQQVLTELRKGKFGGVIVWKLDRWARSLQELIMDIDEITNKGKQFIVLTAPIDTTNASGRLFLQILGAFSEFEREIIRERTIAGLERARLSGTVLGRPRKGKSKYRRPSKEKVKELMAKGMTVREIALTLKTSRYLSQSTVEKIREESFSKKLAEK